MTTQERPSEKAMRESDRPKRARKPQTTVTITATEAKRIARSLNVAANLSYGRGDIAAARKLAESAAKLKIAAEFGEDGAK